MLTENIPSESEASFSTLHESTDSLSFSRILLLVLKEKKVRTLNCRKAALILSFQKAREQRNPDAYIDAFVVASKRVKDFKALSGLLLFHHLAFLHFLSIMSTPGGQSDAMMEDAPPSDQLLFPSSSPVKSVPGSVRRQQLAGECNLRVTKRRNMRSHQLLLQIANHLLYCFLPLLLHLVHQLLVPPTQLLLVVQCHQVD